MQVKMAKWSRTGPSGDVDAFLARPAFDEDAEAVAGEVLKDIRARGDAAVASYAKRFDRVALRPGAFRVGRTELAQARKTVDRKFRTAVREAHRRIAAFARAGMKKDWSIASPRGGTGGGDKSRL